MILRSTITGLLIGCILTLVWMQYDPWVKEQVGEAFITMFETSVGCHMKATVQSVHLWQPGLVLQDVRVTPRDEQEHWYWTAQRLVVSCNWWHVCCYGIIDLQVILEDSHTYSTITGGVLAINNHVNTLLFGASSSLPLFTKSVFYKRADIHLVDIDNGLDIHGTWNSESKKIDNHFKSTIYCSDGSIAGNGAYLQALQGAVYVDMIGNQSIEYSVRADGSARIPHMAPDARTCHITARWEHNEGTVSITNDDHSLHVNMQAKKDENGIAAQGECALDTIMYHTTSLGTMKATCQVTPDTWRGSVRWFITPQRYVEGIWYWNTQQAHIDLTLHGQEPLCLMHDWYVDPGTTTGAITYNHAGITTSYQSVVNNVYQDVTLTCTGNGSYKAGLYSCTGTINNCLYTGSLTRNDGGYEGSLEYDNRPVGTIAAHNTELSGSLHIACIKEMLAALYGNEMQADGIVHWVIPNYQQLPLVISCTLDGTVRIPQTYNVINGARGTLAWDYRENSIRIHDVHGSLYKGSVDCHQATIRYDATGCPYFIHAPCIFNECLLNIKKDLFALVSGHMTYTYQNAHARVTGLLTIDHSQLKENIFSEAFAQRFFKATGMMFPVSDNPIACDVTIKTIVPTHIKTAFLDTTATIDLHVTHTIAAPTVAGTISLGSGSLSFPYKPLYISQGALFFVPGNMYDPLIEFSAKNTIKNHTVSLHVTGSLSKPHVMLESWPPLTQDRIISLLLVGSYQDSLNVVMPALVMNNITARIFGDHASNTVTNKFAALLEPFKRIRLVPSFTDQTGRGGLRGAIEVDVSDRVHAVIQKNFSLTEDTYFELGYLLSDDINVRLLRDERRDMGAEVEMRWKFGS